MGRLRPQWFHRVRGFALMCALATCIALAACSGKGPRATATSVADRSTPTTTAPQPKTPQPQTPTTKSGLVTVPLASRGIRGSTLPTEYTCDGRDVPPPLSWGRVPSGLHELVLFALESPSAQVRPQTIKVRWALAGVNPRVRGLGVNTVPPGAYPLRTSDGGLRYSICPPKGSIAHVIFALYALPPQFNTGTTLTGRELLSNLVEATPAMRSPIQGELRFTYPRKA